MLSSYFSVSPIIASTQESQTEDTVNIKHCHDNSHSREDREREKKVARKRLYVASVICVIFMTGEILGEYSCTNTPFNLIFLLSVGQFFLSNYLQY